MSVSEPSDTLPVRGTDGSSMRLPLQNSGDHNGNAFFASSSSSLSSSSSSCLGELSPESLQNLSSINGGRTNSPLDYDMLEVTLMTMVVTKMDNLTDGVWEPKEDSGTDDKDNISVGKLQMVKELSESSDTSVSLYLDTNSSQYSQDSWNNNDNLTMDLMTNSCPCGNSDALNSGGGGKHDSSTARSESTEIPAAAAAAAAAADDDSDDNDDNEEEVSCLPLSSDIERGSKTTVSSTSQSSIDLLIPGDSAAKPELQTERPVADNDGLELLSEGPDPVLEVPEYDSPLDPPVVQQTEAPPTEDLSENMHSSLSSTSPARESKDDTSPEKAERCAVGFRPPQPYTSLPARAAKTKPTTTKTTSPPGINLPSLEAKRVSKAVLKNIKAKVRSRSTSTPPITHSQNKPAPVTGKKASPRKEGAQTRTGGQGPCLSVDPVKVAVVLKPIRRKSSSLRTNQPERSSVALSQTLSVSISSLVSEEAEDGPPDTPIKAVQEVPVTQGPAESVEVVQQSEDAGEESVVGAGEAVPTKASVEKPRSQIRKVSSKLGPSVRQQGRGTRVDKVSGPAPPSGSGAGPPGQGRTGPRQAPIDGSMLGDAGQNGGGGCPTRLKQLQSQNLGLPKPRTTAERASTLPSLGPPTSNFKPTANQQSGGGSAGRPAPPATSKLPVKGLPTSLSSSSLGSNDTNGAVNKGVVSTASPAFAGPQASTGARPDELPSRSMCPVGSQSMTKPPGTTTPSDTAAPKLPVMRTRALSLQARTTATGLKAPTASAHKTTATSQTVGRTLPSACQGVTKPAAQFSLQRSSSARLSRLNSTVWAQQLCMAAWQPPVDKNKPRETPARPTNTTSSSSQGAAPAEVIEQIQQQQQPPPDQVADLVNANPPVTSVLPVLVADVTNTGSGTTGSSGLGFKARTGSRYGPTTGSGAQNVSRPDPRAVVVDGTAKQSQRKEQAEKKNQATVQLRKLLLQGNKKVEALATVIQHLFTEHEEALKLNKGLSQELTNIKDELVTSTQCCNRLQQEKEEVRVSLEKTLKSVEEQHKEELVQLEDRLRSFYQTEWDKVHQTYQDEADKYRMLMEQQVEDLRSQQEAERKNQETSHGQEMESLKQQYETSIQELKRIQQIDLQNLEKALTETGTSLSEKISVLAAENEALNEKLQAEEERRKLVLTDNNLKDSHTVYLEQELESLKVVLEIKNNQLHQKEKKLMEMDKLVENNVKLEECLKKVQQENEDYKARMDKHAALSKQLSNEQAILQQTLQKESKVNKRLSMENEELLWKLHNSDLLASPRRLSPTSPYSSPRNSASFPTTAPLSPR